MNIQAVHIKDIPSVLADEAFWKQKILPITKHRLHSYLQSPMAEAEDLVLLIAKKEGEILTYIGAFPDRIFLGGKQEKVAWISCFWAHPEKANATIPFLLFRKLSEAYVGKLILTEVSPEAHTFFSKTRQFNIYEKAGKRFYFVPPFEIAMNRMIANDSILAPVASALSKVFTFPFRITNRLFSKANIPRATEVSDHLPKGLDAFLAKAQGKEMIKRNRVELDWMKTHPWILQSTNPKIEEQQYYFSSYRRQFEQVDFLIERKGQITGFLRCLIMDGSLKVPYAYYDQDDKKLVADLIFSYACRKKANYLTIWDACLISALENGFPRWIMSKNFPRPYFVYKDNQDWNNDLLQDGDGEAGFI